MKNLLILALILCSCSICAQIQKNNKSALTIEQIMQPPDKWIGTSPSGIYWAEDGTEIYFDWNPEQDTLPSLYCYNIQSKEIEKVASNKLQTLPQKTGKYNKARTKKVYTRDGNIFLFDIPSRTEKQLTNWLSYSSSPDFVLNDSEISFKKDNNLYTLNLATGLIRQITNFVSGNKPSKKKITNQDQWLADQQDDLFLVLNEREEIETTRNNRKQATSPNTLLKIYSGKSRIGKVSLSPTGNFVIYSRYKSANRAKQTSVTHHVTNSGYSVNKKARPKVGSPQGSSDLNIFDIANNKTVIIDKSQIPGLKDLPDYVQDYPDKLAKIEDEQSNRDINILGPVWHPKKDLALVVALSEDNKDRWILLLDPANGNLELLDRQRDEAWIGGPGIGGWGYSTGDIGWMPDEKSVWFHSEETGYSQLYTVNTETKQKKALTKGEFEISGAFISKDKKHFYFTANKAHPGIKHFYRMSVWGGKLTQLTTIDGGNEVTLSPDEKYIAIRHSTGNTPWELFLQENKPSVNALQITESTTEEFKQYGWRVPEYVTFKAQDGEKVHARLYRPKLATKQGQAVIFVHGAGYLQNAHKWWSSYFREYQFHNYLADNGYTVLDIDYRASAGYGRDWRTGIYRWMGGKDLSDQVDGANFLIKNCDVSSERIGIYGGSYGGFITLMAMFNHPETFKAGAALRSVTDWAHYNHGYTSNILNTPAEDSLAYTRSSPIYFAEGLQGALLMCHGMVDDNVQFQDIIRLTQRLIELGKENWELAVYPVEPHGFREPSSWTDEYKRIFKLFEENLK